MWRRWIVTQHAGEHPDFADDLARLGNVCLVLDKDTRGDLGRAPVDLQQQVRDVLAERGERVAAWEDRTHGAIEVYRIVTTSSKPIELAERHERAAATGFPDVRRIGGDHRPFRLQRDGVIRRVVEGHRMAVHQGQRPPIPPGHWQLIELQLQQRAQ
jgi:hypothetical protein